MDPEKDCINKMDGPLKRNKIFEKLFEDLEKNKIESSGSILENLPKLVLCQILLNLTPKDVFKMFQLNKFFLKFLWTSPNAGNSKKKKNKNNKNENFLFYIKNINSF